jgi:sugar phosphate permease
MLAIYLVFGLGFGLAGLVANMLIVTRWFVRHRGVAVGLLLMGASFGGAVIPLIVGGTLVESGWRDAGVLLAILGAVLMILPLLLIVRNRPQDVGLDPDGATQALESLRAAESSTPATNGPTLLDALKSPVFYLLAFATATLWFCLVGVIQHQAIYLGQDLGVEKSTIPLVFSAFFWASIVGKAGFGYLSDRLNKVHVMLGSIVNMAMGLMVLRTINADSTALVFAYAVIYGMGAGGGFAMMQLVIAEYFAGQAYGKILGIFTFVDTMAGALGTQVTGMIRVASESYTPALNLMLAACAIAAICVIVIARIRELPGRGAG